MTPEAEHAYRRGKSRAAAFLNRKPSPLVAVKLKRNAGIHRRWFWRVRHRYGARHWDMTDAQIDRELRAMSWKRAL